MNISFEKSFASHEKSKYWSDKNKLKPHQVTKSNGNKFFFNCNKCNHFFEASIAHINDNRWCPYCSSKKLCECKECFNKSFASHEKSINWSLKNELNPKQVFKSSNNKYLFNCNKCSHDFEMSLNKITNSNRWCPFCCNPPQKLCENNECKECFNKSFASHEKSVYWSEKNKLNPRQVFKASDKKILFICYNCNNEFESRLSSYKWCPFCKKKTELKLLNWLKENYSQYTIKTQINFQWCKKRRTLPYDFLIKELNLIIELDGPQHFKQISNWQSHEKTQFTDGFKNNMALENGYSILRIEQEIVWYDKNNWNIELMNKINCMKLNTIMYIGSSYKLS